MFFASPYWVRTCMSDVKFFPSRMPGASQLRRCSYFGEVWKIVKQLSEPGPLMQRCASHRGQYVDGLPPRLSLAFFARAMASRLSSILLTRTYV